jgi:hypothetical protein
MGSVASWDWSDLRILQRLSDPGSITDDSDGMSTVTVKANHPRKNALSPLLRFRIESNGRAIFYSIFT